MKKQDQAEWKPLEGGLIAASAVLACLPAAWSYLRGMPWTDSLVIWAIGLGIAFLLAHLGFRRLHKLQERLAQQTARLDAFHTMSKALDITLGPSTGPAAQWPLDAALQQCVQALEAHRGIILLWDQEGQQLTPIAHCGFPEGQEVRPSQPGPHLQERVLWSGQSLTLTSPEEIASLGDHPAWRGMSAGLCTPLRALGENIGILVLGYRQPREFTPAEIELLGTIGQRIALTLANTRLREHNHRAMKELAILQDIDQQLTAALDADVVGHAVVEGVRRLASVDASFLGLWKPGGELALTYGSGMVTAAFRETRWQAGEGLAAQGPGPFIITDGDIHPPASDPGGFIAAEGLKAWIGAPFQTEWGEVKGILYVANRRPTPFNSHQAQLLTNLAARAAISIANARLFRTVERSKQEWEATIDAIEDLFLAVNPDYTIRRCNRAAAEAQGLTPQQAVGQKCYHLFHHQEGPVEDCPVARSLRTGERAFMECSDPHTGRIYHKWAYPLFDAHGQPWAVVEYSRDVTAFQRAQAQLLQAERLSALRQTISGAAHELNNPLTVIMGYAQLLQDSQDPQEIKQCLSSIYRQAQRAREVLENLLTFAPAWPTEGQEGMIPRQQVDVNQLLQHVLALRGYTLRQKEVEVITELAPNLPWILADSSRLQQAFLNIITNAEQALERVDRRRQLVVRTRLREEGDILISFTDNGPGIPPSAFSKLFIPFFTTREGGKGSGLGLSTSCGIVQEHGGHIWAQNNPEAGATFFVTLPLPSETEKVAPADEKGPAPPHILVVDDEYSIVALLQRTLEPLGYKVDGALEGEAALSLLKERAYDLMIIDVKMPGTDGRQVYALINERYPTLRRRIIFATGDTANVETQRFLRERGVPYLTKPFDLEEVQRVVQDHLNQQLNAG